MMSRQSIVLLLVLVILFGASAWAGSWYRQRKSGQALYAQPGYCCMRAQNRCVIQKDFATCRSSGGTSFTWNQASCDAACQPRVGRPTVVAPKAKSSPTSTVKAKAKVKAKTP